MRNKIKSILEENYYPTGLDIQKATDELLFLFRKHYNKGLKVGQIKQGWQEWSRKQLNGS